MDLRAYLLDALADLRGRLFGSVVEHVPPARWTEQADGGGSSTAWLLLHLARHQDLAVQTVIRNRAPRFLDERDQLGLADVATWAGLTEHEDRTVSIAPSSDALVNYVVGVFADTETWMSRLSAMAMESVPDVAASPRDEGAPPPRRGPVALRQLDRQECELVRAGPCPRPRPQPRR
jgi:hypothetical protein